jgi:hypothetical protein
MPILGILASAITGNLVTNSYQSIATVTVGSGGAADVTFSSIPSTYTHLQIRGIGRSTAAQNFAGLRMQVGNGSIDTASNYSAHVLYGDGSSAAATGSANASQMTIGVVSAANDTASSFAGLVLDLLDYANTNKYKTTRSLGSVDLNGSGAVEYHSSAWRSTSAITTVKLFATAGNFAQYSSFALYGIKGA